MMTCDERIRRKRQFDLCVSGGNLQYWHGVQRVEHDG